MTARYQLLVGLVQLSLLLSAIALFATPHVWLSWFAVALGVSAYALKGWAETAEMERLRDLRDATEAALRILAAVSAVEPSSDWSQTVTCSEKTSTSDHSVVRRRDTLEGIDGLHN